MRKKYTRRDEIMEYIINYADENNGPTPTIREIATAFGLGYTTVYEHIKTLRLEGRLDRNEDNKLTVPQSEWLRPPNSPHS